MWSIIPLQVIIRFFPELVVPVCLFWGLIRSSIVHHRRRPRFRFIQFIRTQHRLKWFHQVETSRWLDYFILRGYRLLPLGI